MLEAFDDEEIPDAKTVLFSTVGGDGSRIGKFENHPKKTSLHAEDLVVAMKKLWEADEAPLLLGTSTMMRTIRNYNMEKENEVNIADVMNRVKLLEKGIEKASVEQKNELKSMTEMIRTIGQGSSPKHSFQKDGQRENGVQPKVSECPPLHQRVGSIRTYNRAFSPKKKDGK